MGGVGSGRFGGRAERKTRVEESLSIDVREMVRDGLFDRDTATIGNTWSGRARSNFGFRMIYIVHVTGLDVTEPIIRINKDFGDKRSEAILVTTSACRIRKRRWWFLCPRAKCNRRCEFLYLPLPFDRGFACRRCWNLAYRSSQEWYKNSPTSFSSRFMDMVRERARLSMIDEIIKEL